MNNKGQDPKKREIITVYESVFREKLARLERRGKGDTEEAQRIRDALDLIESTRIKPTPNKQAITFMIAAE